MTYRPGERQALLSTNKGLDFRYAQEQAKPTPLKATPHIHDYKPSKSTCYPTRQQKPVRFYHSFDPYFEFTNFFPIQVRIFDKDWPTTEHFFQAQKFCGTPIEEKIRKCRTAREAFETAHRRDYVPWIRRDWHSADVKDRVMFLAVYSKFSQHKDLMNKLFETGDRKIVEHTSNDSYWGDGGDGSGMNKLGEILERVRDELDPDGSKRKRQKRLRSARKERSCSVDRTPHLLEKEPNIVSYSRPPHNEGTYHYKSLRSPSLERRSPDMRNDFRQPSLQSVNDTSKTDAKPSYAEITKKGSNHSQAASPKPYRPKRSVEANSESSIGITAKSQDQIRSTTPHRQNDSSRMKGILQPAHYHQNTMRWN
jgi:ribA/ribD-fused uncharacterized protein